MKNNLLKKLLILPVFLLTVGMVYGQTVVKGVVSDSSGTLPGVSVVEKGSTNGTQTDFNGSYSITLKSSNATLVFSYLGYKTQEVAVDGKNTINVTLVEDSTQLDEIVVIGYGTTTVKDATGAVTSVSAAEFNKGVITSPEQLIQGKTAGVQITQTSGEPGAGVNIRIRGTNSVRANNNPLFVVDGIPLAEGSNTAGTDVPGVGANPSKNPLIFLNPNDIESISILKDASATAIYGSRGANGVVIITTKSGKAGKDSFEYTSQFSFSNPAKTFDLLTAQEYLSESARLGFNANDRDFGNITDWQDVIYRNSTSVTQNFAYNKGYKSGSLRASMGLSNQQGIVEKSQLKRFDLRLNWQQRLLKDKLKLTFQGTISDVDDQTPPLAGTAGFQGDLIGSAYAANPTWSSDPTFDNTGGLINPANLLANTQNTTDTNRLLFSLGADYQLTENISANVKFGYDKSNADTRGVSNSNIVAIGGGIQGNGRGTYNDFEFTNSLLEATMNYKKSTKNSTLDVLLGFSYQKFDRKGTNAQGWGFNTTDLDAMGNVLSSATNSVASQITGDYQQFAYATAFQGGNIGAGNVFVTRLQDGLPIDFVNLTTPSDLRALAVDTFDNYDELQSFFARVNYSLFDKYLLTATFRADGSTAFGAGNQYGYFPSGAFAWKLTEEDFIPDNVSTLKLRINAGLTGNQEGVGYGNAVRRTRFNGIGINEAGEVVVPGTGVVAFENQDLKWESTFQYGAGIDFGFNNDRLRGTVDYYNKSTRDLLFLIQSAQPAIQPFQFQNLPDSKIINRGIEFALGYDFVQGDEFTWDADFNIAYNYNNVESLSGEYISGAINGQGLSGAFAQNLAQGQPLFSWYVRDFRGFDAQGQPVYRNGGDPLFVGKSALPTITGGLSTSATYKNWSFNAYFTGQFGHYIYNATQNAFFTAGSFASGRNVLASTLTSGESLNAAADPSTRFLEKGDFVRLQTLSASYNVPMKESSWFDSVQLTLTGQNLLLFTGYSGLDPEVSSRTDGGLPTLGIDYGAFPNPRTFTFGINAKF